MLDDCVAVFYRQRVRAIGEIVSDDRRRERIGRAAAVAGVQAALAGAFYDRHGNLWKLVNGRTWVCSVRG